MDTPTGPDYCYSCGRDEFIPPSGAYIVCFECGHAWVTGEDLLERYNQETEEINRQSAREREGGYECLYPNGLDPIPLKQDPEDIRFCPLCLHDF